MKYRAEIDGLRALAVLPVILFHAGLEPFAGGFVGVDVFFVISGYLITSIIYEEINDQRFSIISFYERRARRLLPALFLVCMVSIPFAWAWMLPASLESFFKSLLATNVFLSNVYFWQSSDYFGISAELMPLLHTWSLAVEEQFYLFFPVFLLFLKRAGWSWTLIAVVFISIVSLIAAQWASSRFPSANFFLLPTRLWELGFGAALSLWSRNHRIQSATVRSIGSCIGLCLIFYSILVFDEQTPFPSVWALIPVVGTVLILACADDKNFVGKILAVRPAVFLGLVSYSAYLWHQPIFAFARIRTLDEPSIATMLVSSVVSIGLAYLSWKWVEVPFRKKHMIGRRSIFVFSAFVGSILIVFSFMGYKTGGFPNRLSEDIIEITEWSSSRNPRVHECQGGDNNIIPPDETCVYGNTEKVELAIWGDSHASALAYVLGDDLGDRDRGLREISFSGCPPVVGLKREGVRGCTEHNDEVLEYLLQSKQIQTVILHARWTLLVEQKRFDNKEGGVEPGGSAISYPEHSPTLEGGERYNAIASLLDIQVQKLISAGKDVVIVYPIPEAGWDVPTYMAKKSWLQGESDVTVSTSREVYTKRTERTKRLLDAIAGESNLRRVYPGEWLCGEAYKGRCVAVLEGKPLYSDDDHLSRFGAEKVSKLIVDQLFSVPELESAEAHSSVQGNGYVQTVTFNET